LAFPHSAAFGLRWLEFDVGFLFIRRSQALGPGGSVTVPTAEKIAVRMAYQASAEALHLEHG